MIPELIVIFVGVAFLVWLIGWWTRKIMLIYYGKKRQTQEHLLDGLVLTFQKIYDYLTEEIE